MRRRSQHESRSRYLQQQEYPSPHCRQTLQQPDADPPGPHCRQIPGGAVARPSRLCLRRAGIRSASSLLALVRRPTPLHWHFAQAANPDALNIACWRSMRQTIALCMRHCKACHVHPAASHVTVAAHALSARLLALICTMCALIAQRSPQVTAPLTRGARMHAHLDAQDAVCLRLR